MKKTQKSYDAYEFLIKDRNEIINKIKPGARTFLAFKDSFGDEGKEPFKQAFKEYINDCLKYILSKYLNLSYDETSDILDENTDDCILLYYNEETYK